MKKTYLAVLLITVMTDVSGQTFNWARKGGLWAYDYGYGVATDNAGNVYCAGKYEKAGANFSGTLLPNRGNHDAFVARYDASGGLTWIKTAGGALGDYAQALACDQVNYLYIAGEAEGYGDTVFFEGSTVNFVTEGDNDIFVAKYDLNGNVIWARSDGWYKSEKALAVTYDNAGNVYVAGLFKDTTRLGGTIFYGKGDADIFISKYDANGNLLWVDVAGGPGRDEARGLVCDASGNVYLCGLYSDQCMLGSQTLSSANGYYDMFIAKYASNGTPLWVQTAGGDYDEVAWDITIDNAGKLYVTGEFNASAMFGSTQLITSGNADVFVACYDQAGAVQWVRGAGGPLIDRARGMGTDGTNIYLTGQFGSNATFGSHNVTAADSSDVFFVSVDNQGNFMGAISVTGVADSVETLGYESGIGIAADGAGNVYGTGAMLDGGVFGSTTLTRYGRTDFFVTRISQLSAMHPVADSRNLVKIYPNPADGLLIIEAGNNEGALVLYNCLGEVVLRKEHASLAQCRLDLSGCASGVYVLEIFAGTANARRERLVIEK